MAFGLEFAPLNIPLRRRLQTVAAAAWFIIMAFGGLICLIFSIYLILFSSIWSGVLLYCVWSFTLDKDACETGGRPSNWVRSWIWWRYLKDYFPLKLEKVPFCELDPKKNYLFCAFPHGMLSTGPFSAFGTTYGGFHKLFPEHQVRTCTLQQHFQMPFFRELALGLGGINASTRSIKAVLNKPEGGYVAILMVGGAAEAFNCRPGKYKLVLKNRKGFCKLALQSGSPLVPVFSFGETDLFNQVDNPVGSTLRKVQEWLKKKIGLAPAIPMGRGFFQYNYGIIPHRRPVTTVIGRPIDIEKVENPTKEQIEELHDKFMQKLEELFEQEKHHYLKNADQVKLEYE